MVTIKDVLYVKTLEKRLRRKLTEEELSGEPFSAQFPDGHWEGLQVPRLIFPDELLSIPSSYVDTSTESLEDAA